MSTAPTERQERKVTLVLDDDSFLEPGAQGDAGESNFLELATALARRKWFLLKLTLAAGAIGAIVALLLPKWYTAETRILPPQQQAQSSATALLSSLAGSGLGSLASAAGMNIKNPNDLYMGMLKTRPIADALVRRFDLQKVYRARDLTAARKKLAEETDIVSGKDGMISVSVEDKDKKRAAAMANAYVEELRNLTKGLALTEASQRRLFYEEQLKQAKDDLAGAEVGLKQAQQKSGMIQLDAQAKSIIDAVGGLRARIVAKQVELQALRSFATEQNAQVGVAESELAGMEAELSRMEKQGGGAGSFDLSLKNVPEAGLEYIRAARELKYRETLFEILARQYEVARLDEAHDAALIQVVEPAIEPDRKSFPQRALITVLSALSGLFLACLTVILGQWQAQVQADPQRAAQLKAFTTAVLGK
jgi:tyrosine-protein kinase Etk/Wzc